MLQLLQSFKTGETQLVDIPCPMVKPNHVLIQTHLSLISPGTERMLVSFGKSSLLQKARSQPDKVKQVLDKVKTDGIVATVSAVKSKLDELIPMGYCNVGEVIGVGQGITEFSVGDRVVSNGHHAEVVMVPKQLCAKIPESVDEQDAVFTVIASIALQGIRLLEPTLGETVVVSGLGLIGLLAVQMLRASGCRVLAADFIQERLDLATSMGAIPVNLSSQDLVLAAEKHGPSAGIDGVLLCASTQSDEPIRQAAEICRQRGRIVCVGVVGLNLSRDLFYKKELSFRVSCSYGPGRYDPNYEQKGNDYPIGFVRWTEQRNFQAVLQLLEDNRLKVSQFITHQFPFKEAEAAYATLTERRDTLGLVMTYEKKPTSQLTQQIITKAQRSKQISNVVPVLAVIGAGNYARRILIPAMKKAQGYIKTVVSASGISAAFAAQKYTIEEMSTNFSNVLSDNEVTAVVITTQHHQHAEMVCQAMKHGKAVFVEKPLAITLEQLNSIRETIEELERNGEATYLMVGFNRRFSPFIQQIRQPLLALNQPMNIQISINAGMIPKDHWTQDCQRGGGRLIGEACHFVDLASYIVDADIVSASVQYLEDNQQCYDSFVISLKFSNGSIASINYFANGHRSLPKEVIHIHCAGKSVVIDNFKTMKTVGLKIKNQRLLRQDKGQHDCMRQFLQSLESSGESPIQLDSLLKVAAVCIELQSQCR